MAEESPREAAAAAAPALEVRDLRYSYKSRQALDGVSFSVVERSIHGFVGPNGAGKTTTLKVLATLLAYTVLLCNVALFMSVACERSSSAALLTGVTVVGFLVSGSFCHGVASELPRASALRGALEAAGGVLTRANPLVRIGEVMSTGFEGGPIGFQAVTNLAAAAAFFALAWRSFEFFTRESKEASPARAAAAGRRSAFRWLGVSRPWRAALAWKDFHFLTGGRVMILARFLAIGGLVALVAWASRREPPGERLEAIGGTLMFSAVFMAALDLFVYVARMFADEARWHTLPELMLLPHSTRELAWRKLVGFFPALVPYGVALAIGMVLYPTAFVEAAGFLLGKVYGWHILCQYAAFLSFAGYLSLVLRRAGAPLAVVIWIIGNQMLWFIVALLTWRTLGTGATMQAIFVVLSALMVVLTIVCCRAALARVERLAGE